MSESNPYVSLSEKQQNAGGLSILTNIFTAPSTAFKQIQQNYSIAFPLILMLVGSSAIWFAYYAMVDYTWFIEHIVETTAGELSKAEQDQTRSGMSMMSQTTMGIITAVSVVFVVLIMFVVQTVYFLIVSNINNDGFDFKQWFSFVSWTSMPMLLVFIAMLVNLMSSTTGQISPDALNPLSLNELIFSLEASQGIGKLLSTIHLPQFWSLFLMVIGYRIWTEKSMAASAMIVLLPYILVYIGWYLTI